LNHQEYLKQIQPIQELVLMLKLDKIKKKVSKIPNHFLIGNKKISTVYEKIVIFSEIKFYFVQNIIDWYFIWEILFDETIN
jgi:hypothetical protein